MEIYANAYYTYEPGDFVILTTGDIVCVKGYDEGAKTYTVTDAKADGEVYKHKFVDCNANERTIAADMIYMPVHQEYSLNQDTKMPWY